MAALPWTLAKCIGRWAPAVLTLRGVGLSFGKVAALRDVSLHIDAGERVALVGSNGSGKSSLLRLLHGLVTADVGSLVCDTSVRHAMVFQRPFMLRASVQNNVALGLWLGGAGWYSARAQALQALARVDMQQLAKRNARALSGGQQQRVALARAWARRPNLWLLDEPTASLDPHAKREIEALMADFGSGSDGKSMSMVFASHNLGQVKRLASRVVYLEHGRVLADLPVEDFFCAERLQAVSAAAYLFVKGELA